MLHWLDRFWNSATGAVGNAISSAVHWAMHAVASVFLAVFALVGKAWAVFVDAAVSLGGTLERFASSVYTWAGYVMHIVIPALTKWAQGEFDRLGLDIYNLGKLLVRYVNDIYKWIAHEISDVTKWAIRDIYDPLKSYADQIASDLRKWGYVAWWWITHLPELAEAMIFSIVTSLENHAFEIAANLGKFFLALIMKNLKSFISVLEDIISAVL
jgi:hypothetical protein